MPTSIDWKVATKILYRGSKSRNAYGKYEVAYLEIKRWYIYMELYLSHKHRLVVWLSWVNHNII